MLTALVLMGGCSLQAECVSGIVIDRYPLCHAKVQRLASARHPCAPQLTGWACDLQGRSRPLADPEYASGRPVWAPSVGRPRLAAGLFRTGTCRIADIAHDLGIFQPMSPSP